MSLFLNILRCILCCEEENHHDSDSDDDILTPLFSSLKRSLGRSCEDDQNSRNFSPFPSDGYEKSIFSQRTHYFSSTSSSSSHPPTSSSKSYIHPASTSQFPSKPPSISENTPLPSSKAIESSSGLPQSPIKSLPPSKLLESSPKLTSSSTPQSSSSEKTPLPSRKATQSSSTPSSTAKKPPLSSITTKASFSIPSSPFSAAELPTSKSVLRQASSNSTKTENKTNYVQVESSLIYAIPSEIKSLIKKDIVPQVLKQPLSPLTYKDYFAALLYAEDFYLEKWSNFELKNVILKLKEAKVFEEDKTFVVFEIDSIRERRPFLLSRDLVYAKPSGSEVEPFQGIIHRVTKSTEVLVEFGNDFYHKHRPSCLYDISFSFNRVCLKRAHQAVAAASEPLFQNFLFPDHVTRGHILVPPYLPSAYYKPEKDYPITIQLIPGIQGSPPYLVKGPLCVTDEKVCENPRSYSKTLSSTGLLVRNTISNIYQKSQHCRILVCAPINSTCDILTSSLKKVIPETDLFRANAAFRELDGVPIDILPSCLHKGECFACPSLKELKEIRVILSTYISSFRLHNAGITCGHFSHIFLLDASSATEPEALVALTNFADGNTAVVVTGAPGNHSGWIRSNIGRDFGLRLSYFERLSKREPYMTLNPMSLPN